MDKYFLFKSEQPLGSPTFKELISASYRGPFEFVLRDTRHGYILTAADFFDTLGTLLPLFNSDLGLVLTFVTSHRSDELAWLALDIAHAYRRQSCLHLGDVVFDRLIANDARMLALVRQQFRGVPHELMVTAAVFVDAGLNATRASEKLYIHRNTFNYRLQKFIERTGLDIRDYHHAFYFRIALKATSK